MTYHRPTNPPKVVEYVPTAPRTGRESAWEEAVAEVRSKTTPGGDYAKVAVGDTRASLTWLRKQYPDLEIVLPKGSEYAWMRVKASDAGDATAPAEP